MFIKLYKLFSCYWLIFFKILDEPSQKGLKKEEPCTDNLSGPSTSKSLLFEHEGVNISKSDVDQQCINSSEYFESKTDKPTEHNVFYNASLSIESDHSNYSFSENSVDFSPEESLSDNISVDANILLGLYIYCLIFFFFFWKLVTTYYFFVTSITSITICKYFSINFLYCDLIGFFLNRFNKILIVYKRIIN